MFSVLVSLLGGGFMRVLPELFGLFNKKTDNAHELLMLEKQIQLEQLHGKNNLEQLQFNGDNAAVLALLDAQKSAVVTQMQKTGVRWVDALNFSVRPVVTYYFLALFGAVKLCALGLALMGAVSWADKLGAVVACWSAEDAAILAGVLSFWFVGRVFDKKAAR